MDNTSTIILLNGTSSSGKTCILKSIQELSPTPFLDMGLDKFIWMLPKQYLDVPLWHEVFEYSFENDNKTIRKINSAPLGNRLVSAMHHSIVSAAEAGMNILADHVLLEESWVIECAELFSDINAYLIGVRCPLEVLEERERSRKNRTLGQAKAQYISAHEHCLYDFEIDTSLWSAEQCAEKILGFTRKEKPKAFKTISNRYP